MTVQGENTLLIMDVNLPSLYKLNFTLIFAVYFSVEVALFMALLKRYLPPLVSYSCPLDNMEMKIDFANKGTNGVIVKLAEN